MGNVTASDTFDAEELDVEVAAMAGAVSAVASRTASVAVTAAEAVTETASIVVTRTAVAGSAV